MSIPSLAHSIIQHLVHTFSARPLKALLTHNSRIVCQDVCWVRNSNNEQDEFLWTHYELLGLDWIIYIDIAVDFDDWDPLVRLGMQLVVDVTNTFDILEEMELDIESFDGWNLFVRDNLQPWLERAKEWSKGQEDEISEMETDNDSDILVPNDYVQYQDESD